MHRDSVDVDSQHFCSLPTMCAASKPKQKRFVNKKANYNDDFERHVLVLVATFVVYRLSKINVDHKLTSLTTKHDEEDR